MASTVGSYFAIYFVVWWLVLFAVLPFGVRSQHEGGEIIPGSDPGAPVLAAMRPKLLWTTLISAVLFGAGITAWRAGWLTIERLSRLMGFPF